jgi:hypothetical protein
MEQDKIEKQPDAKKLAIATIGSIIILVAAIYAAYLYAQRQPGGIVLPAGTTYLGPSNTPVPPTATPAQPPTAPQRFSAPKDDKWNIWRGKLNPYVFSYPSSLILLIFPGDTTDSVAISWGNIPPQQNLLINMEYVDQRDSTYVTQPKIQYVRNWWKFFSGLRGVSKVEEFTNTQGLKGYKAQYINYMNATPNTDVFFEIPGNQNDLVHLANGILDPVLFDRIVDSVRWESATPTAAQ